MRTYEYLPIPNDVVAELRIRDDAGQNRQVFIDDQGGDPVRCCLRPSQIGDRLMLVSYAPLRRWASENGAQPGAYDEVGPVFIHAEPCAEPAGTGFPGEYLSEPRVFRAYNGNGHILGGQLVNLDAPDREALATSALDELYADPATVMVHVRALGFGCFQTVAVRRS